MRGAYPIEQIATGLRSALRSLVRPVAVVTAESGGRRFAMAATAFCEVSLDPPSMLVCINRSNATYAAIAAGADFGLNLLAENQEQVSRHCGGGALNEARFEVGDWLMEAGKPPRLADSCAAMVLRTSQMVDQGTHAVVIGEITDLSCSRRLAPLAFHDGGYMFPLADIALKLVAQSQMLREAGGMNDAFLMMDVMRAFYWFDEGLQFALKARGWPSVSRSQSITLANVALGVRRPTEIARNLGVTRQAVSKMLKEMEEEGLIKIEPDPTDGRASWISFSEASWQLRADALDILARMESTLGERIGGDSMKALKAAISKDWGAAPEIPAGKTPQERGAPRS